MNNVLLAGIIIVNFALISYTIGFITEQRKRHVTGIALTFISIGVVLDLTSTTFMILGSKNTPFTVHGCLGYAALLGMLFDAIFLWRLKAKSGKNSEVPKRLHVYSRLAYIWWIVAYITGAILVAVKYH